LGVYDIDLIMSWTPKQYLLLLKGAHHRRIDEYEYMAKLAVATGYASTAKKLPKETKIFNADKARRLLERGHSEKEDIERMTNLSRAFKGFTPQFRKKGGR
jgi:hypothetical protein